MTFNLRVYVGPTLVQPLANEFRKAGITVAIEGTEHIHVVVDSPKLEQFPHRQPKLDFLNTLRERCGTTFGLRYQDLAILSRKAERESERDTERDAERASGIRQ